MPSSCQWLPGGRLCGTLFRRVATGAAEAFTIDDPTPEKARQRRLALVVTEQRDAGRVWLTLLEPVWAWWPAVCAWSRPARQSCMRCGRAGPGWHRPAWAPQSPHASARQAVDW